MSMFIQRVLSNIKRAEHEESEKMRRQQLKLVYVNFIISTNNILILMLIQPKGQRSSPRPFKLEEEDPFRAELARKFASRNSSEVLLAAATELTIEDDEDEDEDKELVDRETFF